MSSEQTISPERIAFLRGRHERDDWGKPAEDERSSLSVGEVGDLLTALDAATAKLTEVLGDRGPLSTESWRQAWDRILADKRAAQERADKAEADLSALRARTRELETALSGLVGATSREELEQMEAMMRLLPMPEEDRAKTINAIHTLLEGSK